MTHSTIHTAPPLPLSHLTLTERFLAHELGFAHMWIGPARWEQEDQLDQWRLLVGLPIVRLSSLEAAGPHVYPLAYSAPGNYVPRL